MQPHSLTSSSCSAAAAPLLQRLFVFQPGDYEAGQAYYFTAWAITVLGFKGPESQPPYTFTCPAR